MPASFYAPGAFAASQDAWFGIQEAVATAHLGEATELTCSSAPAAREAASPRPPLAGVPASAGLPSSSSSPSSSFYPRSGTVGSSGASVPELPWTRQELRASGVLGGVAERGSSRERRHRSSWHAALNKRLVAIDDAEDLLAMVNRELNGFDVLNTVTALNHFSRLAGARRKQRDPRASEILYRLEAWLTRAAQRGAETDGPEAVLPKHLASISIGLARLQWKDSTAGRLLRMVGAMAPEMLPRARARDLSNLAWAFATLELQGFDPLLLAIAREAVVQIGDFTEQNLSNTCWAYAKLGLRHDPLIKAIADETLRKLPQFSSQGLSNTLWGFATLVIKGEECLGQSAWQLICSLLDELRRRLPECPTQQLSNSAWACCRLGVRHDGFMQAVAVEGTRKLHEYTPQDLANTAMAFAKPNINARVFLKALADEAARKIRHFEAREVSNLTWSLSILGPGIIGPEWTDAALGHFRDLVRPDAGGAVGRGGGFEGWEMVQLLNACWAQRASLGHWPELAESFRQRIYGPVLRALAAVVGRGDTCPGQQAGVGAAAAAEATAEDGLCAAGRAQGRLLSAGPITSAALTAAARPPAAMEPLDAARQEAQKIATELQVDFLGPVFTRVALRDLGFVDPEDARALDAFDTRESSDEVPAWGARARAAVAGALARMRAELPFMWFDRFGPHERRVQSWLSYQLEVEVPSSDGPLRELLVEDGRIADFSLDEHRAMCQHGCETLARLQAAKQGSVLFTLQDVRRAQQWVRGLFAQHDRVGHSERQALLEVALEVVGTLRGLQGRGGGSPGLERCITDGLFDGSCGAVVRGRMRLYVCHFYCISCLAAISNFARRFPHVALHTDYDDCWRTRLLDV